MIFKLSMILGSLFLFFADDSFSASFQCSKASTTIEKLICSDQEIAESDYLLNLEYKKIRKLKPKDEKNVVLLNQKSWLIKRNKVCNDGIKACQEFHRKRLLFLEHLEGSRLVQLGKGPTFFLLRSLKVDDATSKVQLYNENTALIQEFEVESRSDTENYEVKDANFDGFLDLLIPGLRTAGPNTYFTIMLYNPKESKLKRPEGLSTVSSPEFLEQAKAVASVTRNHAASYMKTYYKWFNNRLFYAGSQVNECEFNKELGAESCTASIKNQHHHIIEKKRITPQQITEFEKVTTLPEIKPTHLGVCTVWEQGDALHLSKCYKEYKALCNTANNDSYGEQTSVIFKKMQEADINNYCHQVEVKNARDVELTMAGQWGVQVWDYLLTPGSKAQTYQRAIQLKLVPEIGGEDLKETIDSGTKVTIISRGAERKIVKEYGDYSAYWYQVKIDKSGIQGYVFGTFIHPNPDSPEAFIQ